MALSLGRWTGLTPSRQVTAIHGSMMEKELLTAVAAYNLARAVIALGARCHNMSLRQLSFTFALNIINASWARIQAITDADAYRTEVIRLLDATAQGRHPADPSPDRCHAQSGTKATHFLHTK